jgi:dipeptide transport system ATP-binding protein
MNILEVKNLSLQFTHQDKPVQVLRNVEFFLRQGEALGFVGESGSGKSVTSLSLMGLLETVPHISSGEILFKNQNLLTIPKNDWAKIRGSEIAMIFQDPMSSLNPCFTVEFQLAEMILQHGQFQKAALRDRMLELLRQVGIPDPQSRLKVYPHELSGGMSQRIMIAMAIACNPKILIADEPTTALDVTIQKQILQLLSNLRKQNKMSLILVSHDLNTVAHYTDRVQVMYAGEIVESGSSRQILTEPQHPYTRALLKCLPSKYDFKHFSSDFRLPSLQGSIPNLSSRPTGCQFHPRCEFQTAECKQKAPIKNSQGDKTVYCHNPIKSGVLLDSNI